MLDSEDLRAQLGCRENQRLDPDRVNVELDRVCTCIGAVGSLICFVVCNAETIRECIAAALTPKKSVGMTPYSVGLSA